VISAHLLQACPLLTQLTESMPPDSFTSFSTLVHTKTVGLFESEWDAMKSDNSMLHTFQLMFAEVCLVFPCNEKFEEMQQEIATAMASTKSSAREDALGIALLALGQSAEDTAKCDAVVKCVNDFGGLPCSGALKAKAGECLSTLVAQTEAAIGDATLVKSTALLCTALLRLAPSADLHTRMASVIAVEALRVAHEEVTKLGLLEQSMLLTPKNDIRLELHTLCQVLQHAKAKISEVTDIAADSKAKIEAVVLDSERAFDDIVSAEHAACLASFLALQGDYELLAGGGIAGDNLIPPPDSEITWGELVALYTQTLSKIDFQRLIDVQTKFTQALG
jgi:hypothetical protein